jgi:Long-chain acyl-CoA synthetases (AMP-forming)
MLVGASIVFSDYSSGELVEDFKIIKPTLLLGIPKLLEKIHESIKDSISLQSDSKKTGLTELLIQK